MKLGFNMLLWTTSVTPDAHGKTIEALKTAGYDGVEIPVFGGTPADYAAIGRLLDAVGLGRSAITVIPEPGMNPLSPDAAVRQKGVDHVAFAIEASAALGADILCGPLHQSLGVFSGEPRTAVEAERLLAFHHTVGDIAKAHGVTLAIEPLNRFECYVMTTMAEMTAHLDRVGHPNVRGMIDSFHAHIEEKNTAVAVDAALRHIAHVHVSENDRGTPGTGQADIRGMLAGLKADGYDGWLTIEAFSRSMPELAAATRVWRDFYAAPDEPWRDGIGFLRNAWDAA